jgi:hypothetical protein
MLKIFTLIFGLLFCVTLWAQTGNKFFSPRGEIAVKKQNALKSEYNGPEVFTESFNDPTFLPLKWADTITNQTAHWIRFNLDRVPFSTVRAGDLSSAICPWSHSAQNEWILTPKIELPGTKHVKLTFYAGFSRSWLDSASFELYVHSKLKNSWTKVWSAKTDSSQQTAWAWRKVILDLPQYANDKIQLAWLYKGKNGDLVALDGISIRAGGLNTENDILSFKLPTQTQTAVIDREKHIVNIQISGGSDLRNLVPEIGVSTGAVISPGSGVKQSINFGDSLFYIVNAADPAIAPQKWTVVISLSFVSKEADILSFSVPTQTKSAKIDPSNRTVSLEVAYGTNLSAIVPSINVSTGADVSPASGVSQAFTVGVPLVYKVTPRDPTVAVAEWKVTLTVRDYENSILSFSLPGQVYASKIDTAKRLIGVEVPANSTLENVVPNFTLSPGATSNPASGVPVTFKDGDTTFFQVQAANSKIKPVTWKIYTFRSLSADYLQDFDSEASFQDWLTVINNQGAHWVIKNQERVPFTNIYYRNVYSALCPWSHSAQNEWLYSPEITVKDQVNPILNFYAGFNPVWLDSANLVFYVKKNTADKPEKLWDAKSANSQHKSWQWHKVQVSLNAYKSSVVRFAWQYVGKNGDLAGIDQVYLRYEGKKTKDITATNSKLGLYPNPAKDFIVIQGVTKFNLEIYNTLGQVVLAKNECTENMPLYINNLPGGTYIAKVLAGTQVEFIKLLITK